MTMTSSRSYIARALYEWILNNDCTPYILVDAGRPGVEVPQEYVNDGQIVLNVSPSAVSGFEYRQRFYHVRRPLWWSGNDDRRAHSCANGDLCSGKRAGHGV